MRTLLAGRFPTRLLALAGLFTSLLSAPAARAQTVEHPVAISIHALDTTVTPGLASAVIITFRIPRGFWLGEDDPSARIPSATVVRMEGSPSIHFGTPRFPPPEVWGLPIHAGTTRVFTGEITVVAPFTVADDARPGTYAITARITYTPGLNAGHLTTHVHEPYTTKITVVAEESPAADTPPPAFGPVPDRIPQPTIGPVPEDYLVQEKQLQMPQPMKMMFHTWDEQGGLPKFLHKMFRDPENHGKHIQTVWHPIVGNTQNDGQNIGGGMALMNVTREGIMTGTLDISGHHNEYAGNTASMSVVSCPAAYSNYWFSAEVSEDKNRQVHFHNENLTLGKRDRFGYELQMDAFQDPRYRFFGLGGDKDEKDESVYTHEEFGGFLDLYWLPVSKLRFSVGGKVRDVHVKRGARRLADDYPFTVDEARFANVPGIKGATVVGQRFNIVYDGRNQEFTPSDGFYGKGTAEIDEVASNPSPVSNYGRFSLDLRNYMSTVDQKMTLVIRNEWTFTTNENIPFFDQATLGGESSLRAFDRGRFYGQHAVFGSVELRYQAMHMILMGFPMDLEMAPFLDVGQVFNNSGFAGEFNVNPGLSLRLLNRPNIGVVGNGAVGQDGIIFTGSVSLPF